MHKQDHSVPSVHQVQTDKKTEVAFSLTSLPRGLSLGTVSFLSTNVPEKSKCGIGFSNRN